MHHVNFSTETKSFSSPRDASPAPSMSSTGHGFSALADRFTAMTYDDGSESRLIAVGLEMQALAAIYGEEACRLHAPSRPSSFIKPSSSDQENASSSARRDTVIAGALAAVSVAMSRASQSMVPDSSSDVTDIADLRFGQRIRYELVLPLFAEGDADWANAVKCCVDSTQSAMIPLVRILVSLPSSYPATSAPQLQLLGRYLGQFSIDPAFFGEVTRTYISQSGSPFTPGDVCVFEGVEHVIIAARKWYLSRLQEGKEGEQAREMDRHMGRSGRALAGDFDEEAELGAEEVLTELSSTHNGPTTVDKETRENLQSAGGQSKTSVPMESPMLSETVPSYIKIFSAPPITASRSVFIGHACRIDDPHQVPSVIHQLLSDKKISKATHPVIHAYRIVKEAETGSGHLLLSDNDDDGESAAGGRLAHLLQILELENVLVVVSRWYGGVLLGPERFKLINQAARDALELGGFLGSPVEGKTKGARGRGS